MADVVPPRRSAIPRLGAATVEAGIDASTFLLPTGTVTFLLTDVEGSSAAWEAAPDAMAKAISRHYEILADAVGHAGGVRPVEQGEGDSIVAAFSRATDAVGAALAAQRQLVAEKWPDGAALAVRMALHTGDAQLRDAFNYFGQTVIRAARLRSLAHGGQIVVSRATHDLVAESLPDGASWRDLGVHRLKDLGRTEHVFQVVHPALTIDFPSLRGLDAVPNNLPAQLTPFIGRQRELAETDRLLDGYRVVTLTGPGGCGKTRLALQLAADRTDQYPNGVWYVELASLSGTGTVAQQVADILEIQQPNERDLVAAVGDRIDRDTTLLVLDNCEHVADEAAAFVDAVARRCPNTTILATSRQLLDVPGEFVWRVPSMDLPDERTHGSPESLATFDAVGLFCERAARSRTGFVLDDGNADTVVAVCRRLDGIPLAIELAAARVRSVPLPEILRGLDDRFELLTGGSRTLLPRQQTLAASVDWSHDLLDADDQILFRTLSVFAAPFTLDAARAVAAPRGGSERDPVLEGLSRLVDRSLVQLDDAEVPARYRYLETVKAYGRARLAASGDDGATRDRHLRYHLELGRDGELGLIGRDQALWLARLDRSHDDLRTALEWASATFAVEDLFDLLACLGPFWHARGHAREAQTWFDRALREAPDASPERRARVMWASAYQAIYTVHIPLGLERAHDALALAREVSDTRTLARCIDSLATIEQFNDPSGTQPRFLEAAALAESAGDVWCHTESLQKAAYSEFYRGRWDDCLALEARAFALAEPMGNRFFLAWHEVALTAEATARGRVGDGRIAGTRAFEHAVAVGEPGTIAFAGLFRIANELAAGTIAEAERQLPELTGALGLHAREGEASMALGFVSAVIQIAKGEGIGARAVLSQIVAALQSIGLAFPTSMFVEALAISQFLADDLEGAEASVAALGEAARRLESDHTLARADVLDALAQRRRGRPDLAGPLARRALGTFLRDRCGPDATDALEVLAGCLVDLGNATEGARLLATTAAVRASNSWVGLLRDVIRADDDRAKARTTLDDRAESVEAEGAALTLEEASAHAMRAHGTRSRPATGWASLTPTELDVARLVAKGLSNPDIASALVMSRATVKTHVSHVLTKLGLTSRAEVAVEVTRREP